MNVHSAYAIDPRVVNAIPRHGFSKARILVVGDLMLDRYVLGEVNRISPEAPVPVLVVRDERTVAGGAGNVALNIAGLRATVLVAGVLGRDAAGEHVLNIFSECGIADSGIVRDQMRPTTSKTRVMCNNHQIVRIDTEKCDDVSPEIAARLISRIDQIIQNGVDAVVVSDYAKGVVTIGLIRKIVAACRDKRIPVLVDPKRTDYAPYAGATCITPNHKEFKAALDALSIPFADIGTSGFQLKRRVECGTLLVTQGPLGMTAITGEHAHHFPALAEEVFDVSGAGDTVIATLSTCLASGLDTISAVQIANVAASIVVKRAGTVPVRWDELYSTVSGYAAACAGELPFPSTARMVGRIGSF